jgi:hypothetical protein
MAGPGNRSVSEIVNGSFLNASGILACDLRRARERRVAPANLLREKICCNAATPSIRRKSA